MLTRTDVFGLMNRLRPDILRHARRLQGAGPAYILFLSLSNGERRADVLTVTGDDLSDLWQRCTEMVHDHVSVGGRLVRWLRVDWVEEVEQSRWGALPALLEGVKRNYCRLGLSLDPDFTHVFLEGEVNGNALLYGGAKIEHCVVNPSNIRRYARIRHGLADVDLGKDAPVWLFVTGGLFTSTDGEAVHRLAATGLDAGRRVIDRLAAADVRAMVEDGSQYLAAQIGEEGRFRYGWHPCFARTIDAYNSLRHASSLYALLEAWEVTGDLPTRAAIDRGLAYLTDTLIVRTTLPTGEAAAFLLDERSEIKLGGNAVCLLALVKYVELTGDRAPLALLEQLAVGILHMQDADSGAFVHVLHHPSLAVKEPFRIIYYDGEAAFGLMRLYNLTGDPRWLAAVERAFVHFIAQQHWKAHDHWLGYCVNELTRHRPERAYYEFGVRNVATYLDFVIERITAFPTLLEMMMAAEQMVERLQDHPDRDALLADLDLGKFYHALHRRAHIMLNGHFWPETAMYFARPADIVGSFFIRHHGFRVRIDDVEHYLSGYIAYLRYLERSPARSDRPWTPPAPAIAPPKADTAPWQGWTQRDVLAATRGRWLVKPTAPGWRATGLCIWSPAMQPGNMITVHTARSAGVLPTLVARLPTTPQALVTDEADVHAPPGIPVLLVSDTNAAVLAMGRYARSRFRAPVIGITGSAGKTTMVAMMAHILRPWGEIGQTRHNANLPHGIAWNLASMPPEAPFVVLEMAVGRMRESAKLARPTVAIVTNVTAAHLKYHGTVEEVARRKARMFEGMEPGAHAILNRDMPQWAIFADAAGRRDLTIHGYGRHPDADVRLIAYDPATRRADIGLDDRTLSIVLGAPGEHMALNACACIAALRAMAVPVEPSLPMFGLFQAVAGRGAISDLAIGARRLRLIDEAYNANPASMAAAIRLVREVDPPAPEGRRILILGDMLELGPDSAALHAALAPDVLAARPDLTLLCGPDMAALHAALPDDLARAWVPDIASLLTQTDTLFADGDLVLVKSSGGTKLSALVSALKAAASVAA